MKIGIIVNSIKMCPESVKNYTENLLRSLFVIGCDDVEIIPIHDREILNSDYNKTKSNRSLFNENILSKTLSFVQMIADDYFRSLKIQRLLIKNKIDVVHLPYLVGASAPSLAFKLSPRLVVTLHGVAPLVLPPHMYSEKWPPLIKMFTRTQALKWKLQSNIKSIITVSNSEKQNIADKLGIPKEKIKVIYHGVDHEHFKPLDKYEIREKLGKKYGINFDFILHVSSYQPKKNVEGIIKAFALVKNKYKIKEKLVIIGKQTESIKKFNKELRLEREVIFLGHVPYSELPSFYNGATCFIFPSFHESFGMPILEAMACGCPVVTSNIFSCPEVAKDAAILINPWDIQEMVKAILTVISDESLRENLTKKGLKRTKEFSWEKCAKEHLKVYEEAFYGV